MKKLKKLSGIWILAAVLIVMSLACGAGESVLNPATETPTPEPTPTKTPKPTATLKPTETPDVAATQAQQALLDELQDYYDKGYISSKEGTLHILSDYYREKAKIHYLGFNITGYDTPDVTNFIVWADVRWESAAPVNYPEYAGCGFGYRIQDEGTGYGALLTNDSIVMTYRYGTSDPWRRVGTTKGPGTVDFGNPAEASLILIVNEDKAYALVDGSFIGEYTLSKDHLTGSGFLLYSIFSGTNKDYGTRCEITNARLWIIK